MGTAAADGVHKQTLFRHCASVLINCLESLQFSRWKLRWYSSCIVKADADVLVLTRPARVGAISSGKNRADRLQRNANLKLRHPIQLKGSDVEGVAPLSPENWVGGALFSQGISRFI